MSTLIVSLVAFCLGLFGSIPPAGPVALIVISRIFEHRYHAALLVGLGAAAAEGLYAFAAFFCFAALLPHAEAIRPVAHAVTAVVLFVCGIRFSVWKPRALPAGRAGAGAGFALGVSVAGLNPVLLATWSAAVTALYSKAFVRLDPLMAFPFGFSAALGVGAWAFGLVHLMRRYGDRFPHALVTRVVRGMGLVLVGLGAWSAVELLSPWIRSL
jgi:threonine/homoserine/homoserine lactone efflux protein